jgi:hypothetical protein
MSNDISLVATPLVIYIYASCDVSPAAFYEITSLFLVLQFPSASSIHEGSAYTFNSVAVSSYGYCRFYSIQATIDP